MKTPTLACLLSVLACASCADGRLYASMGEPRDGSPWTVDTCTSDGSGASGSNGGSTPMALQRVGDPSWRPVCAHLFAARCGSPDDRFADGVATIEAVLPRHRYFPAQDLFGPGTPHQGSYADELSSGIQQAGQISKSSFSLEEIGAPSCLFITLMLLPDEAAPTGSSADFASGPVLDPDAFPLLIDGNLFAGDRLVDPAFDFRTPGQAELSGPPPGSSYSHLPLIFFENDELAHLERGRLEFRVKISDAHGHGWRINIGFELT